jgi:hypothetical protein
VQRDEGGTLFDIVMSARWFPRNELALSRELARDLNRILSRHERQSISGIILLDPADAFVAQMTSLIRSSHSLTEIEHVLINGREVDRAFVITATRER